MLENASGLVLIQMSFEIEFALDVLIISPGVGRNSTLLSKGIFGFDILPRDPDQFVGPLW